jgi:hypothetical protein
MKRVLILVGLVIALGALPPAEARADSGPCTGTRVALVTLKVTNEPLVGIDGNVWATATYTKTIVIYRGSTSRSFCASTTDFGFLTTIAGTSPAGTGTISGGLTGVLSRSTRTGWFTADWTPSVASSGFVGSFGGGLDWTSLFFTGTSSIELTWSASIAQVAAHGCFVFRLDLGGYFYDITG